VVRVINVLKYWLKVVQLDDTNYVKIVYKVMYKDPAIKPNSKSWTTSVRHLLQSIGFNNVWMNQGVWKRKFVYLYIKERLIDTKLELIIERIFACQNICTILYV